MKSFLLFASLLPYICCTSLPKAEQKVDYSGFKALRLALPEANNIIEAQIDSLATHVLNPGKRSHLDVVVAPEKVDALIALVPSSQIINEDIGAALSEEGALVERDWTEFKMPDESWFTAYHPYINHMAFLLDLQQNFNNYAELFTTGDSFEGRPVIGIHIWGSGGKGSKPTVVVHGTVHAREWITTMTTEYFAYQLLNEYHHRFNATVRALVDKFDYYIIPIVNPDGFVHTQTTDRLWRKNRQPTNNSSCIGRDINRNWPYKWDLALGSSSSPCSEIFKGEAAGDAPENLGLRTQIEALRDSTGVRLYLDIHAYGQFILWPFGYSCTLLAANEIHHRLLAMHAAAAIQEYSGSKYTVGAACESLYATTGSSLDYADAVGNASSSFTWELRDTGRWGFVLPKGEILGTVREV